MSMSLRRMSLFIAIFCIPLVGLADFQQSKPHGFHWYSKDTPKKTERLPKPVQKAQSAYARLMALRQETLNKLAQALLEPTLDSTYEYIKAQKVLSQKNQIFVKLWQQSLLLHPELDHQLNFPTDNSAIAVRNDMTNALIERVIKEGATQYGLLLFYQGGNPISHKFMNHLLPFVKESHFEMISVTVDGQSIEGLPHPQNIPLKAVQAKVLIKPNYLPALFLVNLKTQKMTALSYGFVSLTELKERLLDIATDYKRFTYEGL